jgi:hypothetical protein
MKGRNGAIRLMLLILLCLATSATTVLAQGASVKGVVKMEDGSAVAKAAVIAEPTEGGRPPKRAVTKKNGTFMLPFVDSDTYRFSAEKDGLLIKSISVKIARASRVPPPPEQNR